MTAILIAWTCGALCVAVPLARVLGRIEKRVDHLHRTHGEGLCLLDCDLCDQALQIRQIEERLDWQENQRRPLMPSRN
jgi:hypothetical protein